ncbi:MAG: alpha/beta fold hydrolase [Patulibacter sp.]|nr:alpha/beta fold hydrolase [Patulibacter sp.]
MAPLLHRHPSTTSPSDRPPLLLIHGLGGDVNTWRPIVAPLRRDREVIVAELPGFGAAPPLPDDVEPRPKALARALGAELERQGIGPVHAVGVSLGGWVALELAAEGHTASVTALAPAGFWPRPLGVPRSELVRMARLADPMLPVLLRSSTVRNAVLVRMMGGPGRYGYEDALGLIRGYARSSDMLRVNAAMRARTFDWENRLESIAAQVPVHVVWGGTDPLVRAPRGVMPDNVHVHRLPEAGHMPMFDDPDAIVALLLAVSAENPASSDPRAMSSPAPPKTS